MRVATAVVAFLAVSASARSLKATLAVGKDGKDEPDPSKIPTFSPAPLACKDAILGAFKIMEKKELMEQGAIAHRDGTETRKQLFKFTIAEDHKEDVCQALVDNLWNMGTGKLRTTEEKKDAKPATKDDSHPVCFMEDFEIDEPEKTYYFTDTVNPSNEKAKLIPVKGKKFVFKVKVTDPNKENDIETFIRKFQEKEYVYDTPLVDAVGKADAPTEKMEYYLLSNGLGLASSAAAPTTDGKQSQCAGYKGSSGGGSSCLAGDAQVELKDGSVARVDQLKQGDVVKTTAGFEPVLGMIHEGQDVTKFVELTTSAGALKLSPQHQIFRADGESTNAENVVVGDALLSADGSSVAVTKVAQTASAGFYAPLTGSGTIVAGGLRTSCYANLAHGAAHLATSPMKAFAGLVSNAGLEMRMPFVVPTSA